MKTEFNRNDLAAIKRAAANIWPLVNKRNKLMDKITKLQEQCINIQKNINNFDIPIVNITGYNTEELIERTEDNKYIFKYADTIIPPKVTEDQVNDEIEENNQIDFDEKVEEKIDNNFKLNY